MSGELDRVERESTLRTPCTHDTGAGLRATVVLGVVRDVERRVGELLEALLAVPGDVLQGEKGAVGREEEVEVADTDDGVVDALDHVLEDSVLSGAEGLVAEGLVIGRATEDVDVGALHPVGADGSVNCGLHIATVEVDLQTGRRVVARVHYAKNGVRVRAGLGDVVDVEARVDFKCGRVDIVKDIAFIGWRCIRIGKDWERTSRRRECEVRLEIRGVVASISLGADGVHECVVEEEQI